MSWVVYILECSDKTLYTGSTNKLIKRLAKHASGKGSRYVRSRLPVRLVYVEEVDNQSQALRREHQIKQLTRKQKLEMINHASS